MKFKNPIIILLLCWISQNANADRDNAFYVNTWIHFRPEAVPYLTRGAQLLQKDDLKGARQNLDAAIRADPKMWPAYFDRAQVFAQEGKWELALQDCNTAARLQPKFYRTFIVRAKINSALGRCREALADLNRIISFRPDPESEALALNRRAWLRVTCRDSTIRDPKRALADAKAACKLPAQPQATYFETLAACCAANGDFESAIRYEQQAISSGRLTNSELQTAEKHLARYQHHEAL
jgi:tetratricopeptide (TPR) repeat protein